MYTDITSKTREEAVGEELSSVGALQIDSCTASKEILLSSLPYYRLFFPKHARE
jgi:hypothetical protein